MNSAEQAKIDVSILIVNYNSPELIPKLFASLLPAIQNLRYEIIFVDNASKLDCRATVTGLVPKVKFIQNSINVGFGRANNQAFEHATGQFILLLNTDAFVREDTVTKTISFMKSNSNCGVLGVRLVGSDGELQPSCRYFPTPLNIFLLRIGLQRWAPWSVPVDDMTWDHSEVRECDWVPGCYYLVRREVVDQVGLFDPRYFLYCEEVDHCRAVKNIGWKVIYFPHTTVVHLGGESAKSLGEINQSGRQIPTLQLESELLYFRKHYFLSGVVAHLFLDTLANLWRASASLLKRGKLSGVLLAIKNVLSIWKLFFATHFANVPTR
jgi:N-acetylglucosaminyl-diphospho-decaprenol L-rhamnosyltransferase